MDKHIKNLSDKGIKDDKILKEGRKIPEGRSNSSYKKKKKKTSCRIDMLKNEKKENTHFHQDENIDKDIDKWQYLSTKTIKYAYNLRRIVDFDQETY